MRFRSQVWSAVDTCADRREPFAARSAAFLTAGTGFCHGSVPPQDRSNTAAGSPSGAVAYRFGILFRAYGVATGGS
jgi:hypothetical protein